MKRKGKKIKIKFPILISTHPKDKEFLSKKNVNIKQREMLMELFALYSDMYGIQYNVLTDLNLL